MNVHIYLCLSNNNYLSHLQRLAGRDTFYLFLYYIYVYIRFIYVFVVKDFFKEYSEYFLINYI